VRRRPFTLISAASLLLWLTVSALWVRSYWVEDTLAHYSDTSVSASSFRGRISFLTGFEVRRHGWDLYSVSAKDMPRMSWDLRRVRFDRFGIRISSYSPYPGDQSTGVARVATSWKLALPHWLPFLAFGVVPALWLISRIWRVLPRQPRGFCSACGYDLRATPERCPECGAAGRVSGGGGVG
jgi:hypothetical protein